MAKSQRSKREKRLRTIRREISTPFYDKQESAKLAAQEAALAAPKLPPKIYKNAPNSMEIITDASADTTTTTATIPTDVDMTGDGTSFDQKSGSLKPVRGIGKKMKKKLRIGKGKRHGGKIRRKRV